MEVGHGYFSGPFELYRTELLKLKYYVVGVFKWICVYTIDEYRLYEQRSQLIGLNEGRLSRIRTTYPLVK